MNSVHQKQILRSLYAGIIGYSKCLLTIEGESLWMRSALRTHENLCLDHEAHENLCLDLWPFCSNLIHNILLPNCEKLLPINMMSHVWGKKNTNVKDYGPLALANPKVFAWILVFRKMTKKRCKRCFHALRDYYYFTINQDVILHGVPFFFPQFFD